MNSKFRFSLAHLFIAIAIIVFIAFFMIRTYRPSAPKNSIIQPTIVLKFQNIKKAAEPFFPKDWYEKQRRLPIKMSHYFLN